MLAAMTVSPLAGLSGPCSHLATIDMGQKNWGGLLCPFGWVELGPHLIQCHLGQGLPPYQWHPDP